MLSGVLFKSFLSCSEVATDPDKGKHLGGENFQLIAN
jgi:hypothetical protein